jgi:restriction endonuclease TaqI-like protein
VNKLTRDKIIATDTNSSEIIKPFLFGNNINEYSFEFEDRYLLCTYVGIPIDQYPAIYEHLQQYQEQLEKRWDKGKYWWELRSCDYYPEFEKPKIVFPDIAARPRFAFTDSGEFADTTVFFFATDDMYLLSVLNSKLLLFFMQLTAATIRGGFLRFKRQYVEPLPIRRINFILSSDQRAYYLEKARNLYTYCLDKNDQICVLGFVDHHLSKEPEESDVVHDLLAFLAEEMIRLNKEKRVEQQEFLDWLVSTLKILPDKEGRTGIDVLIGKAKLADYPGDYQKGEPQLATDELLEILRKNKNRLSVSLSDAGLVERVRKMYEESLQRVLPMKEKLRKTDALIDAVVYRLYGLTEEEIKVVEGRES